MLVEDRLLVDLGNGHLEVEVSGRGEPVVVIQTALTADELRPLSQYIARGSRHRVLHYHRRGYAGSSPTHGRASVAADAADAAALIRAMEAAPAHVVGVSYSAAVALWLAYANPELVHTLSVVEPPPSGTASAGGFKQANLALLQRHGADGAYAALDHFMTMLIGTDWRELSERDLPGSVEAMQRNADTFFAWDLPALLSWHFAEQEAARIRCPVLYVGGDETSPWFKQMRARLLQLLPHADEVTVKEAGHLVAATHPVELADLLLQHFRSHPRDPAGPLPK